MYLTETYRSASDINTAMGRVYLYVMFGVIISMLTASLVSSTPLLVSMLYTGSIMPYVIALLPLPFCFLLPMFLNTNPSKELSMLALALFSAIMGLSFGMIFLVYKLGSIVSAFMGASVLFGIMSIYGYFTKRSLDSLGKFLMIGVIAILIASVINLFIGSSVAQMVISALAIVIFTGLTAYDTQKIREMITYETSPAQEVMGALTLYIDFINIFISLLQLTGDKKD